MRDFLLATAETIVSARYGHGMFHVVIDGSVQIPQLVSYLTGVKLLLCDASGHKEEKCSFLNVQLQSLTLTSIEARLQGRLLGELP